MDAHNNPAKNVTAAVGPVASDQGAGRWGPILLALCAVGVGLVIGILALQVTEYLFYKAPPNAWPQPGAGGTVSAPATVSVPPAPVTATTSSAAPAAVSAPASPTGLTPAPASTNAPVVAEP